MCFQILGLIASIVGGFIQAGAQASAARSQAEWKEYEMGIKNRQLENEKHLAFIEAAERNRQINLAYEQQRARNLAIATGNLGGGESRSASALSVYNRQEADRQLRFSNLNVATFGQRTADQMSINDGQVQAAWAQANITSGAAFAGAAVNTFGALARFGQAQSAYA